MVEKDCGKTPPQKILKEGYKMSFKYNKLFDLLKERGITTYKIRKENIISQAALTKMKNNEGNIDTRTLERLCSVLKCQPNDIMEFVEENSIDKLRVINNDTCPEKDNIIIKGQCTGCKFYDGFEMYNGQPCVKCNYYND